LPSAQPADAERPSVEQAASAGAIRARRRAVFSAGSAALISDRNARRTRDTSARLPSTQTLRLGLLEFSRSALVFWP
jgi:hypothetical protein